MAERGPSVLSLKYAYQFMHEKLFEKTPLAAYRLSGESRNPAFSGASLDTGFRRY